jgi:cell division protein FtsI (penicillin-binding protein 3)
MSDNEKGLKTKRIAAVLLGITIWSFLILIRLVQLQIFEHRSFVQRAAEKQQVTHSQLAPRGIIYDSHMDELAATLRTSRVSAEPQTIEDIPLAVQKLAAILNLNRQELLERMNNPKRQSYLVIKHRIDPQAEKLIESLKMPGIFLEEESMRVYPNLELACQTIGFVNREGHAGAGLELQYDKELKGENGQFSYNVDARRKSFQVTVDKKPVQGSSLVLSLDKSIQYIADRELKAGVEKVKAKSGTIIVMESDTGRILALSNYPQFDCNNYNKYGPNYWNNPAVSFPFEPGSTFKVVVAAAALEDGKTRPAEMIDCQMGTIKIGGHPFRDHKAYGLLTFSQILEYSSNVGAATLGLRLGKDRLHEWMKIFGFGSRSRIDIPFESRGLVQDVSRWSGISIGAISFGQEVGVTAIQILTAINTIANGGYLVRPSLVDRIIDEKGNLVTIRTPERVRIIGESTAEAVANAFEGVVLRGTGKRAALEGYRAAGKTGTAQKIVNKSYSDNKFIASFIGFAPLPKPRITVLVKIEEPTGSHYGGDVCAPVFKSVVQEVLMKLNVPIDRNLPLPEFRPLIASSDTEDYLPNPIKPLPQNSQEDGNDEVITTQIEKNPVTLPDFRGLGKRTVLTHCNHLGIRLQANGVGVAVYQSPTPGTKIIAGSTCSVTFAKSNVKKQMASADQYYGVPLSANARP